MFKLDPLPYAKKALEPYISERTLEFHYEKHHQGYVTNLNKLIENTPLETRSLQEVILGTYNDPEKQSIFNNASQVWNHTFYWNSLSPTPTSPSQDLLQALNASFGSLENFKDAFKKAALAQFGSGWAWLVSHLSGDLQILKTSNADTPLTSEFIPLLTCDVWEHAYYLDYQNQRASYVDACMLHLLNWDFAEINYKKALGKAIVL